MGKSAVRYFIAFGVGIIVLAMTLGWALVPKPWYLRLFYSIGGTVAGGGIGAIAGLIVGTLGLAIGGGAIAIAGWLACGLIGAGVGSILGNAALFLSNPDMFTVSYLRVTVLVIVAASASAVVVALSSGAWRRVATRLNRSRRQTGASDRRG